jgi:hypothetical protein
MALNAVIAMHALVTKSRIAKRQNLTHSRRLRSWQKVYETIDFLDAFGCRNGIAFSNG